jgi:hypothetical protein
MSNVCGVHGTVSVSGEIAFQFAEKKWFWLHDGFLALFNFASDLKVQVLTFGGNPSSIDDGLYFVDARVVFLPNVPFVTVRRFLLLGIINDHARKPNETFARTP